LKVGPITELRKRLIKAGAEMHVVKNSLFRLAVKEAGLADLGASLTGQLAVVTGQRDVSAAAKIVKSFCAEFDKPKVRFGYLKDQRLESADILVLADLPSIEVLRAKLLGVIMAPASKLAAVINTPATQVVRVLKALMEKGGNPSGPSGADNPVRSSPQEPADTTAGLAVATPMVANGQ
jgi:large subunit ribosomal protein L10